MSLRTLLRIRCTILRTIRRLCRTILRFHRRNVALSSTCTLFLRKMMVRMCSRCSAQLLGSLSKKAPCVAMLTAILARKLWCKRSSSRSSSCGTMKSIVTESCSTDITVKDDLRTQAHSETRGVYQLTCRSASCCRMPVSSSLLSSAGDGSRIARRGGEGVGVVIETPRTPKTKDRVPLTPPKMKLQKHVGSEDCPENETPKPPWLLRTVLGSHGVFGVSFSGG